MAASAAWRASRFFSACRALPATHSSTACQVGRHNQAQPSTTIRRTRTCSTPLLRGSKASSPLFTHLKPSNVRQRPRHIIVYIIIARKQHRKLRGRWQCCWSWQRRRRHSRVGLRTCGHIADPTALWPASSRRTTLVSNVAVVVIVSILNNHGIVPRQCIEVQCHELSATRRGGLRDRHGPTIGACGLSMAIVRM